MKAGINITIKKEDINKANKTARRAEMIEAGVYNLQKARVFKSKSNYTRKTKHKETYA